MAMNKYSIFFKAPVLQPHHQIQCHIQDRSRGRVFTEMLSTYITAPADWDRISFKQIYYRWNPNRNYLRVIITKAYDPGLPHLGRRFVPQGVGDSQRNLNSINLWLTNQSFPKISHCSLQINTSLNKSRAWHIDGATNNKSIWIL